MSFQNPVFIPGPTNMPEAIRAGLSHADASTTARRCLAIFCTRPGRCEAGVEVAKRADVFFPVHRHRRLGDRDQQYAVAGDRVLAARNGMFSHRWIDMCQRHGLDVQVVETALGHGLPADRYEAILRADHSHQIKAVLATHNETATGVKSDIAAVRRALDAAGHPALLFVDGVSSIGSMDFRMDDWGVDIAVTGSQKGFMLPAGLAIVGFSPKGDGAVEQPPCRAPFSTFATWRRAMRPTAIPTRPPWAC